MNTVAGKSQAQMHAHDASSCLHLQVLPAYADRFAVSIWYSDADAVGAASKAEREAREARKSGEVVSN